MNRTGLRLLLCCLGWVVLTAADTYGQTKKQSSTMVFTEDTWDFGEVPETGGKVSHSFEFTNNGTEAFVIERVVTSCGCTTPDYTKEPIKPGEKGTIHVTFDPTGRPGAFRKTITVTSHSRKNQNQLVITGTVIGRQRTPEEEYPEVVLGGLRVTHYTAGMGYIPRGGVKATTISYYNHSEQPMQLGIQYERPTPYFHVALSKDMLHPGEGGVMTLTYNMTNDDIWGRVTDIFKLTVNGYPTPFPFTATGLVTEDFSQWAGKDPEEAPKAVFSTQYYHFGNTKPGTVYKRDFTIRNTGKETLIVRHVKAGEHMTINLAEGREIGPGQEISFTATLNTKELKAGRFLSSTIIILNDPQRPMRELRLAATIL